MCRTPPHILPSASWSVSVLLPSPPPLLPSVCPSDCLAGAAHPLPSPAHRRPFPCRTPHQSATDVHQQPRQAPSRRRRSSSVVPIRASQPATNPYEPDDEPGYHARRRRRSLAADPSAPPASMASIDDEPMWVVPPPFEPEEGRGRRRRSNVLRDPDDKPSRRQAASRGGEGRKGAW